MKKIVLVVAAVLALGLLGGAVVFAQSGGETPAQSFLGRVAAKLGVSEDQLKSAIKESRLEVIDEKVASGCLSPEQGEQLKQRIESGQGLHPRHHHPRIHHALQRLIVNSSATVLGQEPQALVEQLKAGNSLLEVAQGQGMSEEQFKSALLEQIQTDLANRVNENKLTQQQADRIFAEVQEYIDRIINREPGGCPGPQSQPQSGVTSTTA
ncbi:MAG TPA: hypothetical protein VNL15_03310 [Dehalococcoidia bacterium]|nr:hypothetical protein [Dehalococcoidia bacterium]